MKQEKIVSWSLRIFWLLHLITDTLCESYIHYCHDYDQAITKAELCDGKTICADKSDENPQYCNTGQFTGCFVSGVQSARYSPGRITWFSLIAVCEECLCPINSSTCRKLAKEGKPCPYCLGTNYPRVRDKTDCLYGIDESRDFKLLLQDDNISSNYNLQYFIIYNGHWKCLNESDGNIVECFDSPAAVKKPFLHSFPEIVSAHDNSIQCSWAGFKFWHCEKARRCVKDGQLCSTSYIPIDSGRLWPCNEEIGEVEFIDSDGNTRCEKRYCQSDLKLCHTQCIPKKERCQCKTKNYRYCPQSNRCISLIEPCNGKCLNGMIKCNNFPLHLRCQDNDTSSMTFTSDGNCFMKTTRSAIATTTTLSTTSTNAVTTTVRRVRANNNTLIGGKLFCDVGKQRICLRQECSATAENETLCVLKYVCTALNEQCQDGTCFTMKGYHPCGPKACILNSSVCKDAYFNAGVKSVSLTETSQTQPSQTPLIGAIVGGVALVVVAAMIVAVTLLKKRRIERRDSSDTNRDFAMDRSVSINEYYSEDKLKGDDFEVATENVYYGQ